MTAEQVGVVTRLAKAHPRGGANTIVAANFEFHRSVYSASGNSFLTRTLDQLWRGADRYRLALVSDHRAVLPRVDAEHLEIADAVASRDVLAAEALMRKHVATTLGWLKDLLGGGSMTRPETIESVTVQNLHYRYPFAGGFDYAGGHVTSRTTSLITVTTESGLCGIGSAYSHPDLVKVIVEGHLAHHLCGENALDRAVAKSYELTRW